MFKLPPLCEAIPRILAAVEAGQLQAQISSQRVRPSTYNGPCAIGFLMPDSVRQDIDQRSEYIGVTDVVGDLAIPVALTNDDELTDYSEIQRWHDRWQESRAEAPKKKFLDTLNRLKEKYPCTTEN